MSLTLEIEKVAHGGVFIARDKGQVYFVSGALPGEVVDVEVTETAKTYSRAEVVSVQKASEHRVAHFWKAAAKRKFSPEPTIPFNCTQRSSKNAASSFF